MPSPANRFIRQPARGAAASNDDLTHRPRVANCSPRGQVVGLDAPPVDDTFFLAPVR
jgi:hypothetical protein